MIKHKYITHREGRGVYQIKITVKVPGDNGEVISKKIVKQTKTLDAAIQIRDDLIRLYRLDVDLLLTTTKKAIPIKRKENDLLKEMLLKWYDFKQSTTELQTQRRYNNIVSKVIIPILGNMKLANITHDIIQQMIYTLYKKGYVDGCKQGMAVSSLRIVGSLLKQFFDYYKIYPNPASEIQFPKETKVRREYLSDDEVIAVLDYIKCRNKSKFFLYNMFFETGCRRGELLGLTWRYVDFENGTIQIQQTLVNNPYTYGYSLKSTPKTAASERLVYVSSENIEYLRNLYEYAKTHDENFSLDKFVFLNKMRRPYCPKKVSETFKAACNAVGIEKNVSLHSTRHSFATKMLNNKIPIPIVQRLGGWGKATTLLNVYGHSDNDMAKAAMEQVIFKS